MSSPTKIVPQGPEHAVATLESPRPPARRHGVRAARVAIILVNHTDYAQQYLAECSESLRAQTYPAEHFDVFIVNNHGVTAASQRLTERLAPESRLLYNATNRGWAGGNNTAIKVALQEGFDYLVMLNMDTVVEPDWLEELVAAADGRPDVRILQSKILLAGTHRINSLGTRIHFLGYAYCAGYGLEGAATATAAPLDACSGASMLVKREVFETIGLFRTDYFLYYDDVEFCWRARLAGYRLGVAERSVCHHKYNAQNPLRWLEYLERNRLMTLLTLERVGTLLVIAPCLVVAEAVVSLYFFAKGWGALRWKVLQHFLRRKTWRKIIVRRRALARIRARTDAEIVRQFAGTLLFAGVRNPLLRYVLNPLLALYWAAARTFIVW